MFKSSKVFEKELFKNPSSEYRAMPFWAWNCKLTKEKLIKQIDYLKEMGFGGFYMHSRTGMSTPYLSDEFMDMVEACVQKAKQENIKACLYDEDRWPSGFAGGFVTKGIRYRAKALFFSKEKPSDLLPKEEALKRGFRYFIAAFDVNVNENGEIEDYKKIGIDEKANGIKWYTYVEIENSDPWYNDQAYVDTTDKEAIRDFINITYKRYKECVGKDFGKTVPCIFTDEPQCGASQFQIKTGAKRHLDFPDSDQDVAVAWGTNFEEDFKKMKGYDIREYLPELILNLKNGVPSKVRYDFYDCMSECFSQGYADQCGKWCDENGLALTGHLMGEDQLSGQINTLGETMRSYRSFTIPGIDVLCDNVLLNCAKQVQSAAHQYGKNAVMSELYGVTNWDFDFRDYKFQGDWQAALGVTMRVPHLSWVSMAGEAKRDYPASFNYQSSWYKEYKYLEDHFARLNTVLTRGKPDVKVALIHPVESGWINQGPNSTDLSKLKSLDECFDQLTDWMLGFHIDFDFICESLLPSQCIDGSFPLRVGEMEYETVIIANCETIRASTIERLANFKKAGGKVVFIGGCPRYVDAGDNTLVQKLFDESVKVGYNKFEIETELREDKIVDIYNSNGSRAENLIYNMRKDDKCNWLFIARKNKVINNTVVPPQKIIIRIKGKYYPVIYDTLTGDIYEISSKIVGGITEVSYDLYPHSTLLLQLNREYHPEEEKFERVSVLQEYDIKDVVEYETDEPNVLLLDRAEFSVNGGEIQAEEEILKLENKVRNKLGYRERCEQFVQPWVHCDESTENLLSLRFSIYSDIVVEHPVLAIEDAEKTEIILNGKKVSGKPIGYYVDESIKKVNLPALKKGLNVLQVNIPFGQNTNVEWCYILGDFGVRVEGCKKIIEKRKDKIGFSSITYQGFPFYGGSLTYKTHINTPACKLKIKASDYKGAIIDVKVDGVSAGKIAFAPYTVTVDDVCEGSHCVELTLYCHRGNTFGTIHLNNPSFKWYGSEAWRMEGESWCYEYKLKELGIMSSPHFYICEK